MEAFLKGGKLNAGEKSTKTTTTKPTKKSRLVPWVEKYRPKTVADVVEQGDAVAVLEQCLKGADLPNLLFYGPPGTGKTSTILAAARQLFGDMYKDRILELNASDERGIQVIRDKVKSFSQRTASGVKTDGTPCPAYKIVILDEADSMTHSAQAALRRTMEKETASTRFCLICNYVTRIIEPLTSRCMKFRFKALNESMIFERLNYICTQEDVKCEESTLNTLIDASGGDMRKAITFLQSCAKLRGKDEPISVNDVHDVTGVVPSNWMNDYISICKNDNFDQIEIFVTNLMAEGYSAHQLLEQLNDIIVNSDIFSDKQKAFIGNKLGVITYRLQDGASEYLQLLDVACTMNSAYNLS